MLKLADNLKLPVDVVTQTIAILAKRRAGKSYTMRRLTEQLFNAGQQIVLVDPKGDQWGIRSAADGKAPGLPVVILGGERADVPLEASSGEVVAKLVVEERVSALLDLSLFRKHEVATFMTGFLENLYRLKAREIYRTPMMLVIDEADAVAPQKPQKGEERMLGAAEDIVRRGGQRGIGCTLVSQRSAVLNNNVLTQAQILVVLRTIAPQDLVAMKAWVDVHGTDDEGAELMDSLPSLPSATPGSGRPGWPTADGIFKRVHVLPIETFDSGATPKPGETRREPKTVADVDLDALKRQMSATIEKAKADDPRELRKQIAALKKGAIHPDIVKCPACGKPPTPASMDHGLIVPYTCPHSRRPLRPT
jgi:DNA helicase HerA-like ATPase